MCQVMGNDGKDGEGTKRTCVDFIPRADLNTLIGSWGQTVEADKNL